MKKPQSLTVFVLTVLLGGLLAIGGYVQFYGNDSASIDLRTVGFIDISEIIQGAPYFDRVKRDWREDRITLMKHHDRQLARLQKSSVTAGAGILELLNARAQNRRDTAGKSPPGTELHSHGRESGVEKLHQSKELLGQLKTAMTRKRRAQHVLRQRRRELNEEGMRRIKEVTKEVARERELDVVYKKMDRFYQSENYSEEQSTAIDERRDITDEVLERLKER